MNRMRRCCSCSRYTLGEACPLCGSRAVEPAPAKFSPEDRYGEYRRKAVLEEHGENGKHRPL
ncbi:MAG: RNA-protein complex protein Nop10 [Candidatus Methanoplasma sp.]|jgi:H/ACA ribonucleoprotein complex subunit 3|nr:RNA-protein complex protein Nop10 [Candidatus Methanoplasma sp.]